MPVLPSFILHSVISKSSVMNPDWSFSKPNVKIKAKKKEMKSFRWGNKVLQVVISVILACVYNDITLFNKLRAS